MAEEKKTDSEKLDAISAHLDSLHKRMDSWDEERKSDRAKVDAACAKMDAADKARKDAEEEKAKKDAAEKEEKEKADAARKDAEEKAVKEKEEKEEKEKADAAARAIFPEVAARLAELEKRLPVELAADQVPLFTAAQSKAERVYQAFGDSAGAPRWLQGEALPQYRRRLLSKYQGHSANCKAMDLTKITDDSALTLIEDRIYADAMHVALHPTDLPAGTLREIRKTDRAGRQISEFVGDEKAAWLPFSNGGMRGRFVRPSSQN